MREIKFRAWGFNKMFEPRTLVNMCQCMPRIDFQGLTLMQITGIKDKNGKEIYEGDILEGKDHWAWGDWRKVVTFDGGCFRPFGTGDWEPDPEDVEVIGNIYENPELLKSRTEPKGE